MKIETKRKLTGFLIGVGVSLLFIILAKYLAIFNTLEYFFLDYKFLISADEPTQYANKITDVNGNTIIVTNYNPNTQLSDKIKIIAIDDNALEHIGKWPWRRSLIGKMARRLSKDKPESILFDIFFTESDNDHPEDDDKLVADFKNSGLVFIDYPFLEKKISNEKEMEKRLKYLKKFSWAVNSDTSIEYVKGASLPIEKIAKNVRGIGYANMRPDPDQTFRRIPLIIEYKKRYYASIVLLLVLKHYGIGMEDVDFQLGKYIILKNLKQNLNDIKAISSLESRVNEQKLLIGLHKFVKDSESIPVLSDKVRKARDDDVDYVDMLINLFQADDPADLSQKFSSMNFSDIISQLPIIDETTYNKDIAMLKNMIKSAEIKIPIDKTGNMLINYIGHASKSFENPSNNAYFPFWGDIPANARDLIRQGINPQEKIRPYPAYKMDNEMNEVPIGTLKSDILLIAAYGKGMAHDQWKSPFGNMYGILHLANAINTIIRQDFLTVAPEWVNYLIILFIGLFLGLTIPNLKIYKSLILALLILLLYAIIDFVIFDKFNYDIYLFIPVIEILTIFAGIVVYRVLTEEKEKKQIKGMFGHYVNPSVVDELLKNPNALKLGGENRLITVLFSDVRSFTTISEKLGDPQKLVKLLNEYLGAMTDIILEDDGTLDKYVGDEIMAFWGAPIEDKDHAFKACRSALRQMDYLKNVLQPKQRAEGSPIINIGIGVNTGIMTVGNMGSQARMDYTLMGDQVNLGARLEGTNKMYGTNIIISEFTYNQVRNRVIVRELDRIRVKGKNEPVLIYELLDVKE